MPDPDIYNCQNLDFSEKLSRQRLARFEDLLGISVLKRLLCVCLFLLGAKRSKIAEALGLPLNTACSLIKCVTRDGLPALEDRRKGASSFLPPAELRSEPVEPCSVSIYSESDESVRLGFGADEQNTLLLPSSCPLQKKVVLLSLFEAGLIDSRPVGDLLGCSPAHVGKLAAKLADGDVEALIDQRRGQQLDYRVDEEIKGMLIEQFVLAIVAEGKVSARVLCERLARECGLDIAQRTVGLHMKKLGLTEIKNSLRDSLAAAKKNSKT